jgi:hypothetical protein
LIDSRGAGQNAWTSIQESPPLDFVYSFRGLCQVSIGSVVLQRMRGGAPAAQQSQVKEFKVEVSNSSPLDGFRTVGQFTLEDSAGRQTFEFPSPVNARFLKIRVLSNHGGKTTTWAVGSELWGDISLILMTNAGTARKQRPSPHT